MHKVVFIRHGQSVWNHENRFTGWVDVGLTEQGVLEAHLAASLLKEADFSFDLAYTSVLKRAIKTLWTVLDDMDLTWIPTTKAWQLNERFYGGLTGLNKAETAKKHGDEQVHIWRRSYDTPPPPMDIDNAHHPSHDPRYANIPNLPNTECLKDTVERVWPYWQKQIWPQVSNGSSVIIAAHGNSIRAMMKELESIPDDEITSIEVPTGVPLVYTLDEQGKPLDRQFLGDAEELKRKQAAVANQAKG